MINLSELLELENSEKLELALKTNEELNNKITQLTDLNLTLISKMVELFESLNNAEDLDIDELNEIIKNLSRENHLKDNKLDEIKSKIRSILINLSNFKQFPEHLLRDTVQVVETKLRDLINNKDEINQTYVKLKGFK